jgi:hypothetical protein
MDFFPTFEMNHSVNIKGHRNDARTEEQPVGTTPFFEI